MKIWITLTILVASMTIIVAKCSVAPATQDSTPQIMVIAPWSRSAPVGGDSAVYFELLNEGNSADILLNVKTEIGTAELYEIKEESGVMRLSPISNVEIPAGNSVRLEPISKYVKLINLKQNLTPGKKVNLTLNFQQSDPVTIEAEVREGSRDLSTEHRSIQGHAHN